jgi:hypothetical protein
MAGGPEPRVNVSLNQFAGSEFRSLPPEASTARVLARLRPILREARRWGVCQCGR